VKPTFPDGGKAMMQFLMDGHTIKSDSLIAVGIKRTDTDLWCDVDENGKVTNIRVSERPALWNRLYPPTSMGKAKALEVVNSMPKWNPGTLHGNPVYVKNVPLRVAVLVE